MNHRTSVIIPSTENVKEKASLETVSKWVKCAKTQFAELFGGFTSHMAEGGWMSAQGLVEEPVTVVAAYTDDHGLNHVGDVKAFASKMARALCQEAVAMEVDHRMEFVPGLEAAA